MPRGVPPRRCLRATLSCCGCGGWTVPSVLRLLLLMLVFAGLLGAAYWAGSEPSGGEGHRRRWTPATESRRLRARIGWGRRSTGGAGSNSSTDSRISGNKSSARLIPTGGAGTGWFGSAAAANGDPPEGSTWSSGHGVRSRVASGAAVANGSTARNTANISASGVWSSSAGNGAGAGGASNGGRLPTEANLPAAPSPPESKDLRSPALLTAVKVAAALPLPSPPPQQQPVTANDASIPSGASAPAAADAMQAEPRTKPPEAAAPIPRPQPAEPAASTRAAVASPAATVPAASLSLHVLIPAVQEALSQMSPAVARHPRLGRRHQPPQLRNQQQPTPPPAPQPSQWCTASADGASPEYHLVVLASPRAQQGRYLATTLISVAAADARPASLTVLWAAHRSTAGRSDGAGATGRRLATDGSSQASSSSSGWQARKTAPADSPPDAVAATSEDSVSVGSGSGSGDAGGGLDVQLVQRLEMPTLKPPPTPPDEKTTAGSAVSLLVELEMYASGFGTLQSGGGSGVSGGVGGGKGTQGGDEVTDGSGAAAAGPATAPPPSRPAFPRLRIRYLPEDVRQGDVLGSYYQTLRVPDQVAKEAGDPRLRELPLLVLEGDVLLAPRFGDRMGCLLKMMQGEGLLTNGRHNRTQNADLGKSGAATAKSGGEGGSNGTAATTAATTPDYAISLYDPGMVPHNVSETLRIYQSKFLFKDEVKEIDAAAGQGDTAREDAPQWQQGSRRLVQLRRPQGSRDSAEDTVMAKQQPRSEPEMIVNVLAHWHRLQSHHEESDATGPVLDPVPTHGSHLAGQATRGIRDATDVDARGHALGSEPTIPEGTSGGSSGGGDNSRSGSSDDSSGGSMSGDAKTRTDNGTASSGSLSGGSVRAFTRLKLVPHVWSWGSQGLLYSYGIRVGLMRRYRELMAGCAAQDGLQDIELVRYMEHRRCLGLPDMPPVKAKPKIQGPACDPRVIHGYDTPAAAAAAADAVPCYLFVVRPNMVQHVGASSALFGKVSSRFHMSTTFPLPVEIPGLDPPGAW